MNKPYVRPIRWTAIAIAGILTTTVIYIQPGPRWLWLSDYCPDDPTTICQGIPLGPVLLTAILTVGLGAYYTLTQPKTDATPG